MTAVMFKLYENYNSCLRRFPLNLAENKIYHILPQVIVERQEQKLLLQGDRIKIATTKRAGWAMPRDWEAGRLMPPVQMDLTNTRVFT
jgi:hypothetical protein